MTSAADDTKIETQDPRPDDALDATLDMDTGEAGTLETLGRDNGNTPGTEADRVEVKPSADPVYSPEPSPPKRSDKDNEFQLVQELPEELPLPPSGSFRTTVPSSPSSATADRGSKADPDRFFDDDYVEVLREIIGEIVEHEGPMTLRALAQRVAHQHGWQRTGRRIQERVHVNLGSVEYHSEFGIIFVWAPGSHADRVPYQGLRERAIRSVSRTEIASVIDHHFRELSEADDFVLALSRRLGIARLSQDARAYLKECARWRGHGVAGYPE